MRLPRPVEDPENPELLGHVGTQFRPDHPSDGLSPSHPNRSYIISTPQKEKPWWIGRELPPSIGTIEKMGCFVILGYIRGMGLFGHAASVNRHF